MKESNIYYFAGLIVGLITGVVVVTILYYI